MHAEKQKISITRPLLLTLLAGVFALGIFVGAAMNLFTPLPESKGGAAGSREGFRFIRTSPEGKSAAGDRLKKDMKPFQDSVNELVESRKENGDASTVSVYFRDLNSDNWFGIGERETFAPGSPLKTPIMMAYYKWAESNPLILRTALTYTAQEEAAKQQMPVKALVPGKAYTVNDLILRMLTYDDAAAYALLRSGLPANRLEKVFKDLDVGYENPLSLHAIAAFYRVLFNASYLSDEMSERALRHLFKATIKEGMTQGIPPNIDIAGTYDERTIAPPGSDEEQEQYQVREFGIIYHPNRPFLLGIMVKGNDMAGMKAMVRDITRLVYKEVDRQS
jgi:beta-lactamase class A